MGELLVLGSACCWGLGFIFVSQACRALGKDERDLGVLMTLYVNLCMATAVLIIYLVITGPIAVNPAGVTFFALVGLFSSFLGRFFLYEGIAGIGPARASSMKLIGPIFTIFVGVVFLGEKISALTWLGLVLVLAGLYIVAHDTIKKEELKKVRVPETAAVQSSPDKIRVFFAKHYIKGILLGVLSGFSYGAGTIFKKLGMEVLPSAVFGSWMAFLAGFIIFLPWVCRQVGWSRVFSACKGSIDKRYVYNGMLSCTAQYLLLVAITTTGVGVAFTLCNTDSLFAAVFSYYLLKNREKLSLYTVIGIMIVTAGTAAIMLGKG